MRNFLIAVSGALLCLLGITTPTQAQTAAITLTSITPAVPRPNENITLTGTVVNDTTSTWSNIQVELRIGISALGGRFQVSDWLQGAERPSRVVRRLNLGDISAGGLKTWTMTISSRSLGLPATAAAQGVYPLSVSTNKSTSDARSLLTWAPVSRGVKPSEVALVIPLTWEPARIASGRFLNSSLITDISANGRLTTLLDAGMGRAVTWILDPSLLEAIVDLADGAQVVENSQERDVLPQEQQRASLWLNRAKTILKTSNTYVFPAGNADVVAMAALGEREAILDVIQRGQQTIARDLSVVAAGTAVWTAAGLSNEIHKELVDAGVELVLTTSKAFPAKPNVSYTPGSLVDGIAVSDLDIDSLIASGAPINDIMGTASMVAFERPQAPRSLVISAPLISDPVNIASLLTALSDQRSQATLRLTPLTQISSENGSSVSRSLANFPIDPALLISQQQLRAVASMMQRAALISTLAATERDASIIRNGLSSSIDPGRSVVWTLAPARAPSFIDEQDDYVSALEGAIEISTADRVMLSSNTGSIPVTVRNGLPWSIKVSLTASSASNVRAALTKTPEVITIAPGERASTELAVRVVGTASVPMVVRALNAEGKAVGKPVRVQVGSAAYARVATYVVFGAFILLSLLVLRTTLRRLKKKVA